ncbi:DNA polymerase III subunit alpha [Rickettsiales endosymbiont of Stachyamoeba lipophora]|uniref:DNA polymerase III subunit alpha n=1 Tax=Rickettsiales endosymbiont of Stachyamoeba lipophora TaxID=2486578 RepID=UPI000F6514BF|nr:DNA polymerase III subunit alpha [Rickettsiales endosymbiont of Stachyamoeba lipophora]AZL16401.1 DNA polymerase III subunit alpha [Rickettsiales endosymbiont of Stachyamoeba lipophora]
MHPFIHLKVHSSYSLAQSTLNISKIVELAKANNMPAIALCDKGNLFGALEFSVESAKNGIKPIIACEIPIYIDYGYNKYDIDCLNLYAQNQEGYKNLLHIVSQIYLNPVPKLHSFAIHYEIIKEHSNGLIALTASNKGRLNKLLKAGQSIQANDYINELQNDFSDRLYIEIERDDDYDAVLEEKVLNLAFDKHLPIVATNQIFYDAPSMHKAHDILLCIANSTYLMVEDRTKSSKEHYFKNTAQMNELFADLPEALANTMLIAERCSVMSEPEKPMLPTFTGNNQEDEDKSLIDNANSGLEARLIQKKELENLADEQFTQVVKEYQERLDFELKVITSMKFSGYFLIVSDFIKWSKRNNVPVGPGRGSGAGSLVAWCLEITDLDPLRFGLLFERFLNPDRISMPDFDIDFCQEKRDQVIEYVRNKYGSSRVAQIITFGKLQARAVLKDVGRVMQMPYGQVDKISKMVPHNPASPVTLAQAIDLEPNLQKEIKGSEEVKKLVDIALSLEGIYRHASTHAAGVVIADRDLTEIVPLYSDQKSEIPVIQYSMKYAEMAGLVKFDFLGLKTLTIIQHTIDLLKTQNILVDIEKISFKDPLTYEMLSQGDGVGVFQFESRGMRDTLRKLRPDSIEDLIALGALYRPGPMDNIPSYIARKHGLEEPDYIHPLLEGILKETFGVIIYQEQVMQLAQILAGYSLGNADLLRRAMGKKIKAEMDAQREIFVTGAIKNNIEANQASHIFDLVAKFASYGFNKSHAAAYGLISYQTAYLKANFRVEFLIANLNLELMNTEKIAIFLQEAKNAKIKILPPDINKSQAKFSLELDEQGTKCIRYGMAALKNIGVGQIDEIIKVGMEKGAFKDLEDFLQKINGLIINKRFIENLAKSGSFDSIHPVRAEIVEQIEHIIKFYDSLKAASNSSQLGLFESLGSTNLHSINKLNLPKLEEYSFDVRLEGEYQAFGFYFHDHPLNQYKKYIDELHMVDYETLNEIVGGKDRVYKLAVLPIEVRMRVSQKGRFAYIAVSDPFHTYEVSIFDQDLLDAAKNLFETRRPLYLEVNAYRDEGGGLRIIVQKAEYLINVILDNYPRLALEIDNPEIIETLQRSDQGRMVNITLRTHLDNQLITIDLNQKIKINYRLFDEIKDSVRHFEFLPR